MCSAVDEKIASISINKKNSISDERQILTYLHNAGSNLTLIIPAYFAPYSYRVGPLVTPVHFQPIIITLLRLDKQKLHNHDSY